MGRKKSEPARGQRDSVKRCNICDRAIGNPWLNFRFPQTLNKIFENGWIDRRGSGPRSEIKLTPSGLLAMEAKIQ